MEFPTPLTKALFISREKRFFIHAVLENGQKVIAHTNNTGSMRGLLAPGAEIWLSPANNPARKLKWTLELIKTVKDTENGIQGGVLVGVNTILANTLVREALENGLLNLLPKHASLRSEVKYGQNSRADFLISETMDDNYSRQTWVEVKNVSLVENNHARFPDSPTERGRKHLLELENRVLAGDKAVLIFCIQRNDAQSVGPADDIDPLYGKILRQVISTGVKAHAILCDATPKEIFPKKNLKLWYDTS
ncbi:MAG: DNA/RNA nuclease SfsA [bacterium]|nr:DNA/RNA nuclease SfsA [bacterium]